MFIENSVGGQKIEDGFLGTPGETSSNRTYLRAALKGLSQEMQAFQAYGKIRVNMGSDGVCQL